MTISLYTATTVAAADAGGANSDAALTRLRQRLIVNRFNNEPVTDNASSISGVTGGAGTAVNLTSATDVSVAGYYVFVNRTITLGANATLRAAEDGVHLAFFNCRIETASTQGTVTNGPISTDENLHTGTPTSGAAGSNQNATRSVNYYGCWYTHEGATNSIFHFFTDFFNSTMESVVDTTFIPTTFTGGRIVNGTFRGNANIATSLLSPYRSPEVLEGMVLSAMSYEMPQVGLTQLIQVNPQLLNPFFPQKYRVNIPNGNGAIIHNIGYSSPASNVTDDTITTANAGDAYYFSPGGVLTGGPINYYPWTMRCFSDGAQTQPVENVRFRLSSSVPLNNGAFTLNTVTANTVDTTINSLSSGSSVNAQSFANVARNTVTDYLTDANGRPFLTGARYSNDGGATLVNDTWFDWLRFNIRNTTTNVNALGTAFSNTDAPDNVIFAPVQLVAWDRYNYFAASLEGRSYTNDIHFEEDVRNGVINDANGPQPSEAVSGTTQNLIGGPRTTIVAATEALAESNFGTTVSSKSWQTVYDKLVRDWSNYTTGQFFNIESGQIVVPHAVTVSDSDTLISYGASLLTLNRLSGIAGAAAGDIVSGINVTGTLSMEVPFEGTLSATTLDANNQSSTNAILTTPTINNWSLTATHVGNTVNGATTVNLTNASGTVLSSVIFGDAEPPGTGTITLNADAAVTIQVPDTTSTRFAAGTNVTLANVPAEDADYIFESGTIAGRWAVRNTTKNITLTSGAVVAGTAERYSISNTNTASIEPGDVIHLYYKGTNTSTTGYLTNVVPYTVPNITSDVTVSIAAVAIPDVLFVTPAEDTYAGASLAVAANGTGITVTLTGATASGTALSGAATQNLMLTATDMQVYFDQMVANERTVDYIQASFNATQVDGLTLASSSGTIQQNLQAIEGTPTINDLATYPGVPSVVLFANPAGISATEVRTAVDTAPSVAQIRRGVGYTIDSVFVSAPNSNGPYSNTSDYGDDL